MPDTNWTPGEGYDTRSGADDPSVIQGEINRTKAVRDLNRQRIDSAFPSQGTDQRSHLGSQSQAPDADTTPMPQADPRKDNASYQANTQKIIGNVRMKDYPYPGDR